MINWLIQRAEHCPPAESFLGPAELKHLGALRFAKRRNDWLLGRWTAKTLVRSCLARNPGIEAPLDAIKIIADPDGAPRVEISGFDPGEQSISISHAGEQAFCALAVGPGLRIGADIERIEPRSAGFAADFFTPRECALLEQGRDADRDILVTAIWSAKEAMLKATRHGLRADTRQVTCLVGAVDEAMRGWAELQLDCDPELTGGPVTLQGWWRIAGGFVLTIVAVTRPQQAAGDSEES